MAGQVPKKITKDTEQQVAELKDLLQAAALKLGKMDEPFREISWLVEGLIEQVDNVVADGEPLPNKRHVKVLDELEEQLERESNSSA